MQSLPIHNHRIITMKKDNLKACVEDTPHLSLSPKPMYIDNDMGYRALREMGSFVRSRRQPTRTLLDDESNRSGKRAKGGY